METLPYSPGLFKKKHLVSPKKNFRCSCNIIKSVDFPVKLYPPKGFFPWALAMLTPPSPSQPCPRWFPPSREDLRLRRRRAAWCRTGPCSLRGGLLDVALQRFGAEKMCKPQAVESIYTVVRLGWVKSCALGVINDKCPGAGEKHASS